MKSLNEIRNKRVSIDHSLQKHQQTIGDTCLNSKLIEKLRHKKQLYAYISPSLNTNNIHHEASALSKFKSEDITDQHRSQRLHKEILTEDNFYSAHLCNRSIDELPNIPVHDIKQLKLANIYTIQDLLGRFLIHDTPDEFNSFLIKNFQWNEKTASNITILLHQWTQYNINTFIDNTQHNDK